MARTGSSGARRLAGLVPAAAVLVALACAPAGAARGAPPAFGVADDAPAYEPDGGASLYARLRQLGMTEDRITVDFDPARPTTILDQSFLDRTVAAAAGQGVHVVFSVYPHSPKAFAVDTEARVARYADYLRLLARRYPQVDRYILLNEPNEAAFLAPQFGPDGASASAPVALAALAAGYDALKSVRPSIVVVGLGLSPEANDRTSTSPVRFLHALGAAYRRSGRTSPLMDELGLHIHPRDARRFADATSYDWPNVGPADLDRVKQAVWDAFDGTPQPTFAERGTPAGGSDLRLYLAELGSQVGVLSSLASRYSGRENVAVTDEETQAAVYAGLARSFACDPAVRSALFFLLVDQPELGRFQSGLLRIDRSERPAYAAVRDAIAGADRCATPRSWTHATGVVGGDAIFDTGDRPRGTAVVGVTATAREDASAEAILLPAPDGRQPTPEALTSALGTAGGRPRVAKLVHAGFSPRLELRGRLPDGTYSLGVRLVAALNPRRVTLLVGPVFRVGGVRGPREAPALAARLAADVARARLGLLKVPLLERAARAVDAELALGEARVERGALRVSRGEICAGSREVAAGAAALRRAGSLLARAVATVHDRIRADRSGPGGDADGRDFLWHEAGYRHSLVARAGTDAEGVARATAAFCSSVSGPRSVRSRVVALDDAAHTLRLADGTRVQLADVRYGEAFGLGTLVRASGSGMADGSLFADAVTPVEAGGASLGAATPCVRFRIAPAPQPSSGLLLHDPKGYLLGGKLYLESAARLGAERKSCPAIPLVGTGERTTIALVLTYKDTRWSSPVETTLATGLDGTEYEAPVPLPPTLDPDADASLLVLTQVQDCKAKIQGGKGQKTKVLECGGATLVDKRTYTLRVRSGSWFTFAYGGDSETSGSTVYMDVAGSVGTFRSILLKGLAPSLSQFLLGGTSYSAQARGFLVTGTSSSSPQAKAIAVGDTFAAYGKSWSLGDRYPITGLWEGRLDGTRKGMPFRYSVAQPQVVSDLVDSCSSPEDSFYKLPWQPGFSVKVGQGNNSPFTHNGLQQYAFDFSLADGQGINAPRGGIVTYVQESLTATSDPVKVKKGEEPWAPANALRIEHQDGTASWYYHMQPNGVLPSVKAFAPRGAPVAITGNTGNSTGPHLHYQVQADPVEWTPTIRIRFRTAQELCLIPVTGGTYESSNTS